MTAALAALADAPIDAFGAVFVDAFVVAARAVARVPTRAEPVDAAALGRTIVARESGETGTRASVNSAPTMTSMNPSAAAMPPAACRSYASSMICIAIQTFWSER
jgi:hypothetical protein